MLTVNELRLLLDQVPGDALIWVSPASDHVLAYGYPDETGAIRTHGTVEIAADDLQQQLTAERTED